jgi:putative membrane protein
MQIIQNDKVYFRIILVISILIPVAVAVLMQLPQGFFGDFDAHVLPAVNAVINSMVTICLLTGYYFILKKNILVHKRLMLAAFILSAIFLVSYIVYHGQVKEGETKFGGVGLIRYIYYFFLITHIVLSGIVVPLVLITIYRSTTGQIEKHRRIAKITLPVWLYVAITGVVVYFMISPYYR